MKNLKTMVVIAVVCWVGGVASVFSQGTAFTYQGRLNANGGPATGSYDLAFTLYDSTNLPGNIIAGPITNSATSVTNGLFTSTLDFGAGVFTGNARWLEIAVQTNGGAGFTVLAPRQQITPTPYAIMANTASNLLGTLPTAQLTGTFPANQLSGMIPSANISGTYGNAVSFNNGADTFDGTFIGQFIGSSFLGGTFTGQFLGDGSGLINLNASQLASGTVPYARLPVNLAFVNSNQTFTAQNVFQQPVGLGNPAPFYPLDVMAGQAVGRFIATNAVNGPVIELRNNTTNSFENLGAINFLDSLGNAYGQIAYVTTTPTNHNYDYLIFRVGGYAGLTLQPDPRGLAAMNLIGGYSGNAVSTISSGGDTIAGGGYGGGPNLVLSNSSGVFIGAGSANQIGPNVNDSLIAGGYGNSVQNWDSAIVGGVNNLIQTNSAYSFIGGGYQNSSSSDFSFIGGGYGNSSGSPYSLVGGGYGNSVQQDGGGNFIGGGYYNDVSSNNFNAVIPGGYYNQIDSYNRYATIGGGYGNHILGSYFYFTNFYAMAPTIAGGAYNTIRTNAIFSTIGGGYFNSIQDGAFASTIAGGENNIIDTNAAAGTIGGGIGNHVGGFTAVVPGGYYNSADGLQSFAAGTYAHAIHDGSFVLTDSQYTNFYSTAFNQFSARFSGGVRFETAGAGMTLDGQPILAGSVGAGQLSGNYPNVISLSNPGDTFAGDGTALTLNASQIVTGTLPSAAFAGVYSNAVTLTNSGNTFAGSGTGLTLNASKIISGTLPSAAFAGIYSNAVTLTNSGNVFAGNGAGLINVNAATLNGLSSTAFAPAIGSSNYIQNQNLGFQVASFQLTGSGSVSGTMSASTLLASNAQLTGTVTAPTLTISNATANGSVTVNSLTVTNVQINNGTFKVTGAGIGTSTTAFTHLTAAGNISGNTTYITNSICNGDPNAILIITHNYNPGNTGTINTLYNKNVGVWYTGTQWAIYNEDSTAMLPNIAFNVLIIKH